MITSLFQPTSSTALATFCLSQPPFALKLFKLQVQFLMTSRALSTTMHLRPFVTFGLVSRPQFAPPLDYTFAHPCEYPSHRMFPQPSTRTRPRSGVGLFPQATPAILCFRPSSLPLACHRGDSCDHSAHYSQFSPPCEYAFAAQTCWFAPPRLYTFAPPYEFLFAGCRHSLPPETLLSLGAGLFGFSFPPQVADKQRDGNVGDPCRTLSEACGSSMRCSSSMDSSPLRSPFVSTPGQ